MPTVDESFKYMPYIWVVSQAPLFHIEGELGKADEIKISKNVQWNKVQQHDDYDVSWS